MAKLNKVDPLLPLLWQPHSPLSPLSGRHLVSPLFLPPRLNPSLILYLIPLSPPHLPPSPLSLHVWVTPGWVSLWSWDGFFLPTRALADNTVQLHTNIIKNEKQLVRVAASADMKWKVEERRDGCLTVQRERLKNSQRGPVRSAEGPMARSCADASQTGVFFFPLLHLFVLFLFFFLFLCLREKLITCGLSLLYLSCGCVPFFFSFFLI